MYLRVWHTIWHTKKPSLHSSRGMPAGRLRIPRSTDSDLPGHRTFPDPTGRKPTGRRQINPDVPSSFPSSACSPWTVRYRKSGPDRWQIPCKGIESGAGSYPVEQRNLFLLPTYCRHTGGQYKTGILILAFSRCPSLCSLQLCQRRRIVADTACVMDEYDQGILLAAIIPCRNIQIVLQRGFSFLECSAGKLTGCRTLSSGTCSGWRTYLLPCQVIDEGLS